MSKILTLLLLGTALLSSSCSSTRKSVTLGLGTGAVLGTTTGAALGGMYGQESKGALTGLAIGALVGGIAAYFIDGGLQKRDQETRQDTLFNLEKHGVFGSRPSVQKKSNIPYDLTPATVDEQYIETHVEDGTKLIEGHKVWTIQENIQWTREIPNHGNR